MANPVPESFRKSPKACEANSNISKLLLGQRPRFCYLTKQTQARLGSHPNPHQPRHLMKMLSKIIPVSYPGGFLWPHPHTQNHSLWLKSKTVRQDKGIYFVYIHNNTLLWYYFNNSQFLWWMSNNKKIKPATYILVCSISIHASLKKKTILHMDPDHELRQEVQFWPKKFNMHQ